MIKFLAHGTGSGVRAASYLLQPKDHRGVVRREVRAVRGNPMLVGQFIDSLTTLHRYTSGLIAWGPDDFPTETEIDVVLDHFEALAFAGLESDQYAYSAVLHRGEGDGVHVHLLIARAELLSLRALNIAPPGWEKHFDPLRDYWNLVKGWARPDDPLLARPMRPGRLPFPLASRLSVGRNLQPDTRQITEWLIERIELGFIKCRLDLVNSLKSEGLIVEEGSDVVTVRLSAGMNSTELQGEIYVGAFHAESYLATRKQRSHSSGASVRRPAEPEVIADILKTLEGAAMRRAAFNRRRFGTANVVTQHGDSVDSNLSGKTIEAQEMREVSETAWSMSRKSTQNEPSPALTSGFGKAFFRNDQNVGHGDERLVRSILTTKKVTVNDDGDPIHARRLRSRQRRSKRDQRVHDAPARPARDSAGTATVNGVHTMSEILVAPVAQRVTWLLWSHGRDDLVSRGEARMARLRSVAPGFRSDAVVVGAAGKMTDDLTGSSGGTKGLVNLSIHNESLRTSGMSNAASLESTRRAPVLLPFADQDVLLQPSNLEVTELDVIVRCGAVQQEDDVEDPSTAGIADRDGGQTHERPRG